MTHQQTQQAMIDQAKDIAGQAQRFYTEVCQDRVINTWYQENPYLVLACATGLGYLLAGGLFTPFSRRVVRLGMKAMAIPMVRTQLSQMASISDEDA